MCVLVLSVMWIAAAASAAATAVSMYECVCDELGESVCVNNYNLQDFLQ